MSGESPKKMALRQALSDRLTRSLLDDGFKLTQAAKSAIEVHVRPNNIDRILSIVPEILQHACYT
jgi:hypothetical protein